MKKLVLSGMILCALAAAGWYIFGPGSDMSGSYVGTNDHQAFLVQIVQSGGDQLSGFFEAAALTPGGEVEKDNVELAGVRDGKTFTVTLSPSGFATLFDKPIGLSGTYTGKSISLVGQSSDFSLALNLAKGDSLTYEADVAVLDKRARAIQAKIAESVLRQQQIAADEAAAEQAAAAAQDLENRVETDMKLYATAPGTISARTAQLDELGEEIRGETAKMKVALARERVLGGHESEPGAEISAEIVSTNGQEQGAIGTVLDHLTSVEQNGLPALLQEFQERDAQCQQIGATNAGRGTFNGPGQLLGDCIAMENSTPAFHRQVDQLLAAYQTLLATWQEENAEQHQIIMQSEQ
jgi:hypothetical protein